MASCNYVTARRAAIWRSISVNVATFALGCTHHLLLCVRESTHHVCMWRADSDEQGPDELDQAELAPPPPKKNMLHLYRDDLDLVKTERRAVQNLQSLTQPISVNCFFRHVAIHKRGSKWKWQQKISSCNFLSLNATASATLEKCLCLVYSLQTRTVSLCTWQKSAYFLSSTNLCTDFFRETPLNLLLKVIKYVLFQVRFLYIQSFLIFLLMLWSKLWITAFFPQQGK